MHGTRTIVIKFRVQMERFFHLSMKKKKATPFSSHKCVDPFELITCNLQKPRALKRINTPLNLMCPNLARQVAIAVIWIRKNALPKVCLIYFHAWAHHLLLQLLIFIKVIKGSITSQCQFFSLKNL